jgi:predicted Zn-dependent protease
MATLPPTTKADSSSLRRRCITVLILLAVAATATAAGIFVWERFRVRQERADALQAAHAGRWGDAEPLLRRALERNPDDVEAIKALALGHLGTGQLAEAEPYLSRWCTLRPDDAEPFKFRMDVRHRRARTAPNAAEQQRVMEEAVADGQRALPLGPNDDRIAQEVVWLLMRVGRFDEADSLCRDCLRRQPDDPWLTYLLAKISHGREDPTKARALLDALLKREPRFTPGLLLRAVLYNEAGESGEAVPLLRQVLALDRDDPKEARYQLSLALARTGQAEEAQRLMAEVQRDNLNRLLAATHDPDTPGVKLQRAEIYLAGDQEAEALRLLAPMLEHDPGSAAAHALLADYYAQKGQLERAAEHRRRAEK